MDEPTKDLMVQIYSNVLDGKPYLFGVDKDGDEMYVRYSTPDYSEVDEEDENDQNFPGLKV